MICQPNPLCGFWQQVPKSSIFCWRGVLRFPLFIVISLIRSISLFGAQEIVNEFTFSNSNHGWVGEFADYPVGGESFFELAWGWENLPVEISTSSTNLTKGFFLTGNNHSDDLFMFAKRQIEGLQPNAFYDLIFSVWIESNVSSGFSVGIGGSPGKSVFFKVGASCEEPKKVLLNDYYLLNVDKGNQASSGKNALVIGDLESPALDPYDSRYCPKQLGHRIPLRAQSDSQGRLWIFLGTDSGFEGTSKFYIAQVNLQLDKVERELQFPLEDKGK